MIMVAGAIPSSSTRLMLSRRGHNVRRILSVLLLFVVTHALTTVTANNHNNRPPNLLWFCADQQRWDTIGIVQAQLDDYKGKFHIRTPNIDRLARMGVLFNATYCVSSVRHLFYALPLLFQGRISFNIFCRCHFF